ADKLEVFELKDTGSHKFGYRKSFFAGENAFVLSVKMRLEIGDPDEIKAKMDEFTARRRSSQPLELPSAGSTFKRPEGFYAGRLIEDSGLKGYRVGGACVSQKHAGFIVNDKGATATDILALIDHVKDTVYGRTGVMLEPEVRILGEW
ncbi:UDP-N-acetylenolpyruvoylglucosamine reductase, partial [Candidatus Nomurabacteria bacterium]|nr:UDP-N-acetylenolpyruvoylglucosamine reductase [Candidatus Nomurabacteria bacterium]